LFGGLSLKFFIAVVIVLILFGFVGFAVWRSNETMISTPSWSDDGGSPQLGDVDVTVLRIAVDGRARKFVQSELARIAGLADTATDDGRATMLREVAMMLRRLRDAWIYGGAVNQPMQALGAAKQTFDKLVDDARVRFQHETITNEQGQKTTAVAPASTPRADEGAGLILVSIVVAARIELFNVNRIGDGEDLRKALDSIGHLDPQQLVAVEVVWEPSEDDDRLSSMELEAKYPRPELIPITGALAGKVFCSFCGGPFPGELVTCPHCGAPAPGRETAPVAQHAA
jgi:uncharacterized membrane protein